MEDKKDSKNNRALKGLLSALLFIPVETIFHVNIENPIEFGTYRIGILDFWLPDKTKEFYSEYKFMNMKNHEIYSSKFGIRVLNLKAVDDDSIIKEPEELYEWAKLFKADTWEELKVLAEKNEYDAQIALDKSIPDRHYIMKKYSII